MNYKIRFKNGEEVILKGVSYIEFPKVKTICFVYENELCSCYYTKAIEKMEVI